MKKKLLTDVQLRAQWSCDRSRVCTVEEGTILTPAAKDFLKEQGITLEYAPRNAAMTVTPIPVKGGAANYVVAATGQELSCKPEDMTHLRGNLLIPKTHPRIVFRGKLDSLMAQIIGVQLVASETKNPQIAEDLEELLAFARHMLAAEVKDQPLEGINLLGMDSAQLRRVSQDIRGNFGMEHPVPSYRMGRLCVALNRLRTQVREVELSAAQAFAGEEGCTRPDIIEGLNRLSSCVYILFCRKLSGRGD